MTTLHPLPSLRAKALAFAVAACLGSAAVGASAQAAVTALSARTVRNADFIVAVVNTEAVTSVELAHRLERVEADAKRNNNRLPDADTLRQQVLDVLIDERVQITFAREAGQKVDTPTSTAPWPTWPHKTSSPCPNCVNGCAPKAWS